MGLVECGCVRVADVNVERAGFTSLKCSFSSTKRLPHLIGNTSPLQGIPWVHPAQRPSLAFRPWILLARWGQPAMHNYCPFSFHLVWFLLLAVEQPCRPIPEGRQLIFPDKHSTLDLERISESLCGRGSSEWQGDVTIQFWT